MQKKKKGKPKLNALPGMCGFSFIHKYNCTELLRDTDKSLTSKDL